MRGKRRKKAKVPTSPKWTQNEIGIRPFLENVSRSYGLCLIGEWFVAAFER